MTTITEQLIYQQQTLVSHFLSNHTKIQKEGTQETQSMKDQLHYVNLTLISKKKIM